MIRKQIDVDRQFGIAKIDTPALRVLDAAADLEFDLGRRQREALVRSPRRHAKRRRMPIGQIAEDRRGHFVEIERPSPAGV